MDNNNTIDGVEIVIGCDSCKATIRNGENYYLFTVCEGEQELSAAYRDIHVCAHCALTKTLSDIMTEANIPMSSLD